MFSHDENSVNYSACDTKYGDISELKGYVAREKWYNKTIYRAFIENKIKPKDMQNWFSLYAGSYSTNPTTLQRVDGVENIDTSQCTNMTALFCNSQIVNLDLSSWDTSNVVSMSCMFQGCQKLSNLNISSFDTSLVGSMNNMFERCFDLTNIVYGDNFIKKDGANITGMFLHSFANRPEWLNEKVGEIKTSDLNDENIYKLNRDGYTYLTLYIPKSIQGLSDYYPVYVKKPSNSNINPTQNNTTPTQKYYKYTISGNNYVNVKLGKAPADLTGIPDDNIVIRYILN